ncbi:fumarylacetoacetase [Scleromatobacter humisilvae]|uniref:fumarylacetoacetase n=1 Tax=Scleromatobacter humisilvae TaxID=2897159 RepID=A0A9X2BXM2_9BURK|nr:fumarylacetoacetase [Scleromatobacter humisilvae]MCK9684557.1 fumarylacetoacetase [Scleromatobacter humisilvae]
MLDHTHAPDAQSWVSCANAADTDFPIQNLPFGRFRRAGSHDAVRVGVAIGDQVLDLHALGQLDPQVAVLLGSMAQGELNGFMAQGRAARIALRHALFEGLSAQPSGTASLWRARAESLLVPQDEAEMALPCRIGDYTDFYTGIHHATTVGKLFRPDNPLLPNYKWVPIGYHGRSSSIGVSGQAFPRPWGQVKGEGDAPVFAPSRRLDYELELGFFVGPPNAPGMPLDMAQAEASLFGATLLNDWSARDVQAWEYQPLGPFLAKNFSTTISPWIVTMEALAPFRAPFVRDAADPQPLPYLDSATNRERGAIAIGLEVWIQTHQMRAQGQSAVRVSASSFADAYWTPAQLLAHHASNGCNLQPGDLMGSGTQSGPAANQGGSLLELSQGGKAPFALENGETRTFLQDGDCVILRGFCESAAARRIGFGDCAGTLLPAMARA